MRSTILCLRIPTSQVRTEDFPAKFFAPWIAATSVSCTASSACAWFRSCSVANFSNTGRCFSRSKARSCSLFEPHRRVAEDEAPAHHGGDRLQALDLLLGD